MLDMQRSKSRLKSRLKDEATNRLFDYRRIIENYLRHLHLLLIGLLFVLSLSLIFTKTYPSLPIFTLGPIDYWPIALLFFLASFFLLTFITLNTLRGLLLSSAISWLLLFKLNGLEVTYQMIIIVLIISTFTEFILVFLKKSAQT